eukprot:TRINITY_DN1983_c0_g1_i1.p1 TRINITY_DN1983_c0_g1~~TRINITY_DN1983_c0_g1_i1.p1  ORF type:complete len:607 (+),score=226.43 TRINITY_DN1983_c0_g1_i1:89-1909(+)
MPPRWVWPWLRRCRGAAGGGARREGHAPRCAPRFCSAAPCPAPAAGAPAPGGGGADPHGDAGLQVRVTLMRELAEGGSIPDSTAAAARLGVPHQVVAGQLASLESGGWVTRELREREEWGPTPEGAQCIERGTPEALLWAVLQAGPVTREAAEQQLGAEAVGFAMKHLMRDRAVCAEETRQAPPGDWLPKGPFLSACGCAAPEAEERWRAAKPTSRVVLSPNPGARFADGAREQLRRLRAGESLAAGELELLRKRKLAAQRRVKYWAAAPGPAFPRPFPERGPWPWQQKLATDLSREALLEAWGQGAEGLPRLKPVNLEAHGRRPDGGHQHPLMRLRQEYREIFLELGFQEMDTQRFVDSSFWNFDALFVPQKHPARDAQDTFFLAHPEQAPEGPPAELLQAVGGVHEGGRYGSAGYACDWSEEESRRNVLRTHTTAVSAHTLAEIGTQFRRTGKLRTGAFFSIDRVFRNEQMDRTHLCEFHQIEGFVIDYGLSLGHMMALLRQFFEKVGVPQLRFKPTYNPYTEPSMEVHGWHEGLKKVIEVGNSGVFRPEMLLPMGIPEDATVIAWGLGLERPAMMFYKLDSVHDLFGHRVSLPFIKSAAMPRI